MLKAAARRPLIFIVILVLAWLAGCASSGPAAARTGGSRARSRATCSSTRQTGSKRVRHGRRCEVQARGRQRHKRVSRAHKQRRSQRQRRSHEAGSSVSTSSGMSLFSPTSIWNKPLASNARLASNSAGVVRYLNSFVRSSEAEGIGPWINTLDYSVPIYTVGSGQATRPVYLDASDDDDTLETALSAVPIPAGARPAAGSDAQMVVYQPSKNSMWELWDMHQSLTAPRYVSAGTSVGGELAPGAYTYAVTALSAEGETTVSPEVTVTVAPGQDASIGWVGVPGAVGYRIYRSSGGGSLRLVGTVNHHSPGFDAVDFTDTGSEVPSVPAPTTNTAATPGQWHAGWGGRMLDVSTDPGYYRDVYSGGQLIEQSDWGATASSLPLAAGLITLADLASGHIDHAIALMVPKAKAGTYVCPAQRTDGYDTSRNAIPEGAHLRLKPSLDLSKIAMPRITRMIAVAAQRYGFIVNDQTGVTVGFRAQDPTPLMRAGHADPYLKYFKAADGEYEYPTQLLASFPWSKLELLAPPRCS